MQLRCFCLIASLCSSLRVEGSIIGLFISIYYFKRSVKINPLPADVEPCNIQRLAKLGVIPPTIPFAKGQADSKRTFFAVGADYDVTLAAISLACFNIVVFKGYALQVGSPNLIATYYVLFLFHHSIILLIQNRRRIPTDCSQKYHVRQCGLSGRRRLRGESYAE